MKQKKTIIEVIKDDSSKEQDTEIIEFEDDSCLQYNDTFALVRDLHITNAGIQAKKDIISKLISEIDNDILTVQEIEKELDDRMFFANEDNT